MTTNKDPLIDISKQFIAGQVQNKDFIPTLQVDEIIVMLKKTLTELEENKDRVLSFYMVSAVSLPEDTVSLVHKSVSQLYMLGGIYHSVLQELKDNNLTEEEVKQLNN